MYPKDCARGVRKKREGGARAWAKKFCKMDVAGLEVDVLREERRWGPRDYLQKKVVHGTGHGECR